MVRIINHLRIEVRENSRSGVILRVTGVVNLKIFNGDSFWHVTRVSEIMKAGIRSVDQGGAGGFTARGYEYTVADYKFSLPGAAVIGAQVDEASSAYGTVLYGKGSAPDGIDSHVPQG